MRSWTLRPWSTRSCRGHTCQPKTLARSKVPIQRQVSISLLCRDASSSAAGSHALIQTPPPPLARQNGNEAPCRGGRTRVSVPLPSIGNRKNPSAWISVIEAFLPPGLRESDSECTSEPVAALAEVLAQAEGQANVDVLSHIAVVDGRWEAFSWLAHQIIESSTAPHLPWRNPTTLSSIEWPSDTSLDDFTETQLARQEIVSPTFDIFRAHRASEAQTDTRSLANVLSPFLKHTHDEYATRARKSLGQIWVSLGRVVIAAAEEDTQKSTAILSRVVSVLWKLHSKGFLPKDMFLDSQNPDHSALQQPSLVSHLSRTVLSPPEMSGLKPTSLAEIDSFAERRKSIFQASASEQWLEYILWCCVHGGWLMEGVAIVNQLSSVSGRSPWKLMWWRHIEPSFKSPAEKPKHSSASSAREPNTQQESVVTRTVSAEVVAALSDGLVSTLQCSIPGIGHTPTEVVQALHILRHCLDREKLSLGSSTWDAIIARLADSPVTQEKHSSTRLFESVLELAKFYAREARARNTPTQNLQLDLSAADSLSSYIFDGSAAVIGFYHRALHAHIKARDVSGALRVLAALQRLTDKNKQESLQEFFAELKSREINEGQVRKQEPSSPQKDFPGVNYPGFFPSLPLDVLAGLLDLLNDCDALELGRWMIYSSDVDGPLIPESEHGNQVIAPALIRFAASTSDTDLLRRLMRAQTASISGYTLVALCESRIRQGNFNGAIENFGLIRDYSLHEWAPSHFSLVLRALLLQVYGRDNKRGFDHPHSQQASELCQKLLRGDLGQVWGTSFAQLDTIVQVLSSLDEHLAQLCSNLLPRSQQYMAQIGPKSFNYILEGAVKVWGSKKGMEMWEYWCRDSSNRRLRLPAASAGKAIARPLSVAEQFSSATPPESARGDGTADAPIYAGRIKPTIVTIRIIIQQAIYEHRQGLVEQQEDGGRELAEKFLGAPGGGWNETIRWASGVLRDDFGLGAEEMEYEVSGLDSTENEDDGAMEAEEGL